MTGALPAGLDPFLPDLHLDVLYEHRSDGRLLRVRSSSVTTPLVHLLRTPTGNRWLINAELPEDIAARLDTTLGDEPAVAPDDWEQEPPRSLDAVRDLLRPFRALGTEYRGPAFAFPAAFEAVGRAEVYRAAATDAIADGLEWIAGAAEVEHPIVVARDEQARIVSACHAARATGDGAEAGLETAPQARRHGHALAVTSWWAEVVQSAGRTPLYSTGWANEASRGVARRLGLQLYAEDWHIS
ncbi:MAG: GNAT family N-acetyltransferase [Dehalococcoidia bacterium]